MALALGSCSLALGPRFVQLSLRASARGYRIKVGGGIGLELGLGLGLMLGLMLGLGLYQGQG